MVVVVVPGGTVTISGVCAVSAVVPRHSITVVPDSVQLVWRDEVSDGNDDDYVPAGAAIGLAASVLGRLGDSPSSSEDSAWLRSLLPGSPKGPAPPLGRRGAVCGACREEFDRAAAFRAGTPAAGGQVDELGAARQRSALCRAAV